MIRPVKILRHLCARWRNEDGNATIEFVILFPAFMTLFLIVFETGMMLTRGVMLDRGLDIAMRELRLGTLDPMTHDGLKTRICEESVIIPDCSNSVHVALQPVSKSTWSPLTKSTECVDREKDIKPDIEFESGTSNELMLVRVCSVFDPFFPSTGLAAQMKLESSGDYALITTSAFVNEP